MHRRRSVLADESRVTNEHVGQWKRCVAVITPCCVGMEFDRVYRERVGPYPVRQFTLVADMDNRHPLFRIKPIAKWQHVIRLIEIVTVWFGTFKLLADVVLIEA